MYRDNLKYAILVIDDNGSDFKQIEQYLNAKMLSPEVYHVDNWDDAKTDKRVLKTNFDAILLNLVLPDRNAENLIKEVVAFGGGTPVIVLTDYANTEFSIKSVSLGIADYLLKDDVNAALLYKSIVFNIERKRLNRAIRESEEKYKFLFQNSPNAMLVWDINDLSILDCNEEAEKKFGYTKAEFFGMTIKDLRPAEDVPQMATAFQSEDEFVTIYKKAWRQLKKTGEIMVMDVVGRKVDYRGKTVIIAQLTDITEKLKYVNLVEEQNFNLREIAWTQSHMVRAPLVRIMGLLYIMKNHKDKNPELDELIEFLEISSNELDNVIRDIIDLTQTAR
jgi:PAS domain S-box-containing protein